jgi:5'-3' exonuclease
MTSPTNALIDADLLVYRVGFASQDVNEGIVRARLEESIARIMDSLELSSYRCILSPTNKSNFRYAIYPEYKANRSQPKPIHYDFIRLLLESDYGAEVTDGQEADDALGIAATKDKNSIIVTIDKDLDQIPGWHYNFVKQQKYNMSELEASRQFYTQVLVGDVVDNVKGCPKIGKTKAPRILDGCQNVGEMLDTVVNQFQINYKPQKRALDALFLAGRLLWIRKDQQQEWCLPNGKVVSKDVLESFLAKQA